MSGAGVALAGLERPIAAPGRTAEALADLPTEALGVDPEAASALRRLGFANIGAVAGAPRTSLARRFGTDLIHRIDQVLGREPDPISPVGTERDWRVERTLMEPLGDVDAVMAELMELLAPLCTWLEEAGQGARRLTLSARRVDHTVSLLEVGLARPMREPERIAALFRRGVEAMDAGFGIEHLTLEAIAREPLELRQLAQAEGIGADRLADLMTRLANRVGFEHVLRVLPGESHLPEHGHIVAPAAYSQPAAGWPRPPAPRPLVLFPPEPIAGQGPRPPSRFRWRGQSLATAAARGPERIAPEWWLDRPEWRSGMRDYWRVETDRGQRLWLFHTPTTDAWAVQGVFA